MSRCKKKRFLAFLLTVAMLLGVMPVDLLGGIASVAAAETVAAVEEPEAQAVSGNDAVDTYAAGKTYVLEAKNLTAFDKGAKKDGDTEAAGTNDYFTLIYSAKSKVDSSSKKFTDGYSSEQRINFGAAATTQKNVIQFTTSAAATVTVWWVAGDANRPMSIRDASGTEKTSAEKNAISGSLYISTLTLDEAGTYYLGGFVNNNYIFKVEVTEKANIPEGTTVKGNITVDNKGYDATVTLKPQDTTKADITLKAGVNDISLYAGVTYDIVTSDSDVRAVTSAGATKLVVGTDNVTETITLGAAKTTAKVTLAEGSELAAGASLTLTNTADDTDTVNLVPGEEVTLKVGATYKISVDMALTTVTVNDAATITVAEDTTELVVALESQLAATTITVTDYDGILGNGTITLTNIDKNKSDDTHTFQSGDVVNLVDGETYKVSCSVADVVVKIESSKIYKASKKQTTATVAVSKKSDDLYELDLTQGLKAGVTYDGGISVLTDFKYSAGTKNVGGVLYEGAVQSSVKVSAGGAIPTEGSALKLEAKKSGRLYVPVSLATGSSAKIYYFLEETKDGAKEVWRLENTESGTKLLILPVEAGKTYYLYVDGANMKMYGVTVDYREAEDWKKIADPVLGTPTIDGGTIKIPYKAQVGGIYGESLEVTMTDANGKTTTQSVNVEGNEGTVTFEPKASGTYSFRAELTRKGETSKVSNEITGVSFILPMAKPESFIAQDLGAGKVKLTWMSVPEAEQYRLYQGDTLIATQKELLYRLTGLTVGATYTFYVEAVRGNDVSPKAEVTVTTTENGKRDWYASAFGSSVDAMSEGGKNNGYSGSYDTQDLKVWSMNSKGKLVPNSTDGVAFYYTTIDPETENFTLSADVTVDTWKFTNGQEGFGLMAADRVGENGSGNSFWNNSYMVSATKVEYYWDAANGQVSDAGDKYTMKLGVGSQEKIGVTKENLAADTVVDDFQTAMRTLETSAVASGQGAGTYNMVGGYAAALKDITDVNPQTTFHMTLQRNNTGYFLSYTNVSTGETVTNKYYHGDDGDELTKLDENNIYVGFFASRSASVSFSNMSLTTIAPEADAPAESRPITYVTPNYTIESATVANTADYEMVYYGNADGTLTIANSKGEAVVSGQHVDAKTKFRVNTVLEQGDNTFTVTFAPDADYKPAKYSLLSSYETVTFNFTVKYNVKSDSVIYVSPEGKSSASGTKYDPLDIYTAVKSVAPGQTILLMSGTYALDRTVVIDRGMNGTANAKIYMIADPEGTSRPVLDFQEKCAGMILAGNYWYFQGFDVTRSANAQKGIQVSGSYNTVDNIMTYRNGNTGLQISRYKSTDNWEDWPSHNLILNCTSYLNADAGYEDADGFAAKLTVADGNVFDGCIAAYNADDGWDLFAKVETGSIGQVTIQNCVAFKNGYVLDENGQEIDAGNGNGFKMGGSSITGQHILSNSVSFGNKAKGIDSNSCPDIQVFSSTSYNNESYNVALYTNDAKNTAFVAEGILSFKDSTNAAGQLVAEQFKPKGTQETSAYENAMNYYWRGESSTNSEGAVATAAWFRSTDMNSAIHGGIYRNANGTINMNGFLEVTSAVPEKVGARMTGTPSGVINVNLPTYDNNDNNNNNNSSDSDSDDDNSASSAAPAVDWNEVSSNVQNKVAEMLKNPAIASVNMNFVCSGEVKVPQNVLNMLKGTKITIAFHSGNGVALSISGQDLKNRDLSKIQNIDLTVDQSDKIPANLVNAKGGAVNKQLTIRDTGSFAVPVNLHVNVGKDNAGKSANLYRYNAEKGRLEYCGSFTVTSNGQSMFALYRGGSYVVTVTDRRPSESIWYMGGDYTVKSGDTLSAIAKRSNMTLSELLRRNAQITNKDVIRVGQKLNLN